MGPCMTAHARTCSGVTTTHARPLPAQESKRTQRRSSVVLQEAGLTRALRTRLAKFEYNFYLIVELYNCILCVLYLFLF